MIDEAYDRLEALGEARELAGVPEPSDDAYWEGVLPHRCPHCDALSDDPDLCAMCRIRERHVTTQHPLVGWPMARRWDTDPSEKGADCDFAA